MRLVIDMQGAQSSERRKRGIGRYALSFTEALIQQAAQHEVILLLNGAFPESIPLIKAQFDAYLQPHQYRIWFTHHDIAAFNPENQAHRQAAALIRERVILELNPDWVVITSLFEGFIDNTVVTVSQSSTIETAVILYDLIPLRYPNIYLSVPENQRWYHEQLLELKKADLLLAISNSSAQEAIEQMDYPAEKIVTISSASTDFFQPITVSEEQRHKLQKQYGITEPFMMYTGGNDWRKNIEGLVRAYCLLSAELQNQYLLVIVCKMSDADQKRFRDMAQQLGTQPERILFTGYVSDADLLVLYNLAELFVFPSWHEGFGLPVLEAMQCHTATIVSNCSSLPEVIDFPAALFDPHSPESIAAKITEVLTNPDFKTELIVHSQQQVKKFSWEQTAQRALQKLEAVPIVPTAKAPANAPSFKPKLAYFSPLPPAQSGISDYSAELLQNLVNHYHIHLITDAEILDECVLPSACQVVDIEHFKKYFLHYDRVLYHFGNSHFHEAYFDLLRHYPGVVVLHDFYLSGPQALSEKLGLRHNAFYQALYESHGYTALLERLAGADEHGLMMKYPCNYPVLAQALGVIVHSHYAMQLAKQWYGDFKANFFQQIPLLRQPAKILGAQDKIALKNQYGFAAESLVICSFGFLNKTKLNHFLLDAFLASELRNNPQVHLVFVGKNPLDENGQTLQDKIQRANLGQRIKITGWTEAQTYQDYLCISDMAVQLRTLSRGETSAAVLDCMNYGIATIVNANGSMAELDPQAVRLLPDLLTDQALIEALEQLADNPELRHKLGQAAQNRIRTSHNPESCAQKYAQAIEDFYVHNPPLSQWLESLKNTLHLFNESQQLALADAVTNSLPRRPAQPRLFLDVTATYQQDHKTGIERVVKALITELIQVKDLVHRIEPVYLTQHGAAWQYRYATGFTLNLFGHIPSPLAETVVDAQTGDLLVILDISGTPFIEAANSSLYRYYQNLGVEVTTVLYDLLPLQLPEVFPPAFSAMYENWLQAATKTDHVLAISQSVAEDFDIWLENQPKLGALPTIDYWHLGANASLEEQVISSVLSREKYLDRLPPDGVTFLMIGTIEPRKAHLQVLQAFDLLWQAGRAVNLIVVGREGWREAASSQKRNLPEIIHALSQHSQRNERFFWLDNADDDLLQALYQHADALIFASYGEGFGLPLIEAAQYRLPIIARDLKVFREVAGASAFYFPDRKDADVLSQAIHEWIELYQKHQHPCSSALPYLTWQESALRFYAKLDSCSKSHGKSCKMPAILKT
ncbi:glycosyltransferase [Thiomicrorhabdus cannonii]|uniref:glycosyltransferase n=1 Tax=Thiomicrorhabdus cannonii TaxID=2748011 RepID=UPI0015BFCB85|nr:glycosyltransferase [Thiomicrorhabdus cannonii]